MFLYLNHSRGPILRAFAALFLQILFVQFTTKKVVLMAIRKIIRDLLITKQPLLQQLVHQRVRFWCCVSIDCDYELKNGDDSFCV